VGGFLEMSAITGFDEDFFDLAVRTVNYAVEFGNTEGYVPLRIVDILKGLLELTLKMEISRKEFYSIVLEKIETRDTSETGKNRAKFLDELLDMFINEWNKSIEY
jgi:hypothetical protein